MNTKKHGDAVRDDIVDFIIQYINKHQYPPSIREIGNGVGLRSTSTVHAHIKQLIDDGKLETDANESSISRALRVPGYTFTKKQ